MAVDEEAFSCCCKSVSSPGNEALPVDERRVSGGELEGVASVIGAGATVVEASGIELRGSSAVVEESRYDEEMEGFGGGGNGCTNGRCCC